MVVINTTTLSPDALPPTASQVVAVGQATLESPVAAGTATGLPGTLSVMGMTMPSPEELSPTAW